MKQQISNIKTSLEQPWLIAIILSLCIPIFPEYVAPFLAVASLLFAYLDTRSRNENLQIGTLGKILLAYIVYMAFGLLYTNDFFTTMSTLLMWIVMFMVYLAMTSVIIDKKRLDSALFCLCLVVGFVGFIGTLQYLLSAVFKQPISMQFWRFIDSAIFNYLPFDIIPLFDITRPCSTFNNPNIYAEFMVMTIPFVAYYSFSGKRTNWRVFCRCCFLFSITGVLLSFSRGAYVALIVMLLVFCIANIKKTLIFIMGIITSLLFIPGQVMDRFFSISLNDLSISNRFFIWDVGIRQIVRSPILGAGAGVANSWNMLLRTGMDAPHLHNLYLQLLFEGGVIALILMGTIGWLLLKNSYTMLHDNGKEARNIGVALIAFVGAFCTHGLVDFPLMTPKLVGIFIFVIAIGDVAISLFLESKTVSIKKLSPYSIFSPKHESASVIYRTSNKD